MIEKIDFSKKKLNKYKKKNKTKNNFQEDKTLEVLSFFINPETRSPSAKNK